MKKLISVTLGAVLGMSLFTAKASDWYAPQDPFVVYGNTYYIGTHGISSVLITSPAGHILIDAGAPQAAAQVVEHIRKLGFKVEDIRYILSSHEHLDHAGAIAALQKLSGATVLASPEAVKVLQSGLPDKGDAQYPNLIPMEPVMHPRVVRDGEVIVLGPLSVTAHFTPGHTKGATSWTWRSSEGGKPVDMVYADSLTAMAAEGRRFSGNPLYPSARADIERSIASIESIKCDVLVSAHPEFSGLWERKAKQAELGNVAFIDQGACRRYGADAREILARTLAAESVMAEK